MATLFNSKFPKMKRKLLLLLLSFIFLNSYGQIDFVEKIVIGNDNATNNPSSVFGADLDGDGDIDMISSSIFDDKIAWYENLNGQGNYGNQQVISLEATDANSVFAIDIDGDGDIDVVSGSGNFNEGKVAWYENIDGLGNFGDQIVIAEEPMAYRSIFSADLDGDGDNDILASYTNPNGGKLVWYENLDGLGTYGTENILNNNAITVIAIFAADIDGDGDMDVLSGAGSNSPLGWYENMNSQGQFGSIRTISNSGNDSDIHAVDIDDDGDLDVLSTGGERVSWYENIDGMGSFGVRQIINDYIRSLYAVFPSDIDGDGDIDVVSGYYSDSNPAIVWNENIDGIGNFGPPQTVNADSLIIVSVYNADVDNDGDFDILFASEDRIGYHENMDGIGNFGPQIFFTYNVDSPRYVDLVDLDNDGFLDVLSASYLDGEIAWYKKNGRNGNFGIQRTISKKNFGAKCVQGVDMDNDGDVDVLYSTDFMVAWHENLDGNGNFGTKNIIYEDITGPSIYEINAADMDGDGDLDIVYASYGDYELVYQENLDGNGTFGPRNIIYSVYGFAPISMDLTDIDNDGKIDILCSSIGTFGEEGITWIKNLGNGTFGSPQSITLDILYYVEAADIDGDNDKDIVATNRNQNSVIWFENLDGQGNFSSEKSITSNLIYPITAYSADIDKDGDLDVISASYYDQKIVWYENLDGLGNFGTQNILKDDAHRTNFVYADDVDADGDVDIFAIMELTNEIIWFKNSLILGLEQQSFFDFSIYPNPSSDFLNIVSQEQLTSVEVYNSLGQLILTNQISRDTDNPKIEVKGLTVGLYFIKIRTVNGEVGLQRFLKE